MTVVVIQSVVGELVLPTIVRGVALFVVMDLISLAIWVAVSILGARRPGRL